jgi:RNA recognition motif-containing protein
MNIFVGNIAPQVSDQELEDLFKKHGDIRSVKIIRDMFTQASKGFGFVEMKDKISGETAIKELNAFELNGKKLVVNEARPQADSRKRNTFKSGGSRKGSNRGR